MSRAGAINLHTSPRDLTTAQASNEASPRLLLQFLLQKLYRRQCIRTLRTQSAPNYLSLSSFFFSLSLPFKRVLKESANLAAYAQHIHYITAWVTQVINVSGVHFTPHRLYQIMALVCKPASNYFWQDLALSPFKPSSFPSYVILNSRR